MGIVFLDFEASSLEKHGYPIEVAWVFADGGEEEHLIRPASAWTDWSADAEAIHRISRERLVAEGTPHDAVARRMVDVLTGHALYATAPSWDGQWLSKLLRAASLPRHALRLKDTDEAHRDAVIAVLQRAGVSSERYEGIFQEILGQARLKNDDAGPPEHRALADAQRELQVWRDVRRRAEAIPTEKGYLA
ncbi:3'-5' exonuclease [Microvirga roseola]|uniref:3'-5' exonuclease n=1 Tax=Microvirga roseola TaxID=2883126 RepID=UPI001E2AE7B2|nr:transcriptional regulator [Microvirga roseola]